MLLYVKFLYPIAAGDVIEGLSVCLLMAQSKDNGDWEFTTEIIKILMDRQQLVEYDRSVIMCT